MRDYSNYVFYPETGRKYYFLYVYLIGKAYLLNTFFPIDITVGTISRNNIARWFYMLEEGKDFKEQLETFVHNPNLLNQAKKVLKKSELTIKKKLYHDISELSNDELINKFNIFTVESIKAINIA
ncbi:MAG: hypothetical protein KKF89_03595, partial [Nanoarchaeota archaeon]|nr:hypothetical protein [Nanoarchaeota archaeon]